MSNTKVPVGSLSETIQKLLDEYGDKAKEAIDLASKDTANKVKKELRSVSPGSGKYKRSWSVKTEKGRLSTTSTVYSKLPGLPHLLEYPHMLRNGRASRPQVHIYPVYQRAEEQFEQDVKKRLEQL